MHKLIQIVCWSALMLSAPLCALTWEEVSSRELIRLYAGDVPATHPSPIETFVGLSLKKNDARHIQHDILNPMPLPDNCVDRYQSEDVFEHIEYAELPAVIDEIYRVLKPGGLLRISIPDYRCDVLYDRSWKDAEGNITFDPGGGGRYVDGRVVDGGHVWFPVIELMRKLLKSTKFYNNGTINYLHYYTTTGKSVTKKIDYSKGFIKRTPDNDVRVQNPRRAMSLVVDLYKAS